MTHADVLREFPYLTEEDIRPCLAYAADRERKAEISNAWLAQPYVFCKGGNIKLHSTRLLLPCNSESSCHVQSFHALLRDRTLAAKSKSPEIVSGLQTERRLST